MIEEVDESFTETNIEELADIIEVIYALAKAIGHDIKKLDEVRCKKCWARILRAKAIHRVHRQLVYYK